MNISDQIFNIKAQYGFARTPNGRSINDKAMSIVKQTIDDTQNYEQKATECKNCCIILSSLLIPKGCPNCGGHDWNK